MVGGYRDFAELVLHAVKDRDYQVISVDRGVEVTIVAIHGGSIEPLTSELAAAIAGEEYNLYALRGLLAAGGARLRVPVQSFDELRLRGLLRHASIALSLDGVPGSEAAVHLGGKNRRLKRILTARLCEAGFEVRPPAGPGAAHDPTRFYNQTTDGGVQLECTHALRASLVDGPLADRAWEDPATWNDRFCALVIAARGAVEQYRAEVRDDLARAQARFEETTRSLRDKLTGDAHDPLPGP